jgi:uncharacterized RDD family membrane protein YckC
MTYISVGRRFAALLLDWIILLVVAIPLAEIHSGNGSFEISWLGWRFALAWIAVPLTYVVLFEWLASATPGKLMVGIRVRKDTGGRIGFGQSLGRNAARLIDGLPYVIPYLVGGLVVLGSDTRQRLGDRWASTVVIAKGTDGAPIAAPVPMSEEPWTGPLPPAPPGSLPPGSVTQGSQLPSSDVDAAPTPPPPPEV